MGLNDVLYRRQYKIQTEPSVPPLDLKQLKTLGLWINPIKGHYVVTLTSDKDPNNDIATFTTNFKKITQLASTEFKIEPQFGPFTLQNAVDSPWF